MPPGAMTQRCLRYRTIASSSTSASHHVKSARDKDWRLRRPPLLLGHQLSPSIRFTVTRILQPERRISAANLDLIALYLLGVSPDRLAHASSHSCVTPSSNVNHGSELSESAGECQLSASVIFGSVVHRGAVRQAGPSTVIINQVLLPFHLIATVGSYADTPYSHLPSSLPDRRDGIAVH